MPDRAARAVRVVRAVRAVCRPEPPPPPLLLRAVPGTPEEEFRAEFRAECCGVLAATYRIASFCVPQRAAVVASTMAWSSSVDGGIFTLVSAVSMVLSRFLSDGIGSGPAVRGTVVNIFSFAAFFRRCQLGIGSLFAFLPVQ